MSWRFIGTAIAEIVVRDLVSFISYFGEMTEEFQAGPPFFVETVATERKKI